MPLQFFALDNEFAVATGSNVNSGPGTSTFDYPPNSTMDLIITVNDGDTDPRLFEVGDTYDLSFGGNGATSLEDAVVIRSDAVPGGGAIVFEGLDQNGDLTQVVWSPGFDLEQWYFDNYSPPALPGFYTTDQNASYSHSFVCFAADTRLATGLGGIRVADLWEGDRIQTLDSGPAPVRWIGGRRVSGQGGNAPVSIAPGALGNHAPLRLSQQHRVLLRLPQAELLYGSAEVLVPAKALVNGIDIRITPCDQITYVHVLMKQHHILLAEGAPCESLLPGDETFRHLPVPDKQAIRCRTDGIYPAARPVLSMSETAALLGRVADLPTLVVI